MAFFKEKCVRCGTRTSNKNQGVPTCNKCLSHFALTLQAAREQKRACPVDGTAMSKEVAHMILIDRCPDCQGIWLDRGELELIKGGVERDTINAMAGFSIPIG